MHRFLKTPAALTGTPAQWKELPVSGAKFLSIEAIFRCMLVCSIINYKKQNTTNVVAPSLSYCMHVLIMLLQTDQRFRNRMRVFFNTLNPTAEMIHDHLQRIVRGSIQQNGMTHKFGVVIHENFGKNCNLFHTNTEDFQIFFDSVWNELFPSLDIQRCEADVFFARKINEVHFKSAGLSCSTHSSAAIVAQNSVTVMPSVPAHFPRPLFDEPLQIVHETGADATDSAQDDATELYRAFAEACLRTCVANAVAKAAKSFDAGNLSTVIAITDSPLDAQVLANAVTRAANDQALKATEDAIAALEVVEAVTAAANSGKSVQLDMPSSTEFVPGDSEAAGLFLEIAGESDNQFHANGAGGPLSVILERTEDGADQSSTSSPHSPNGEGRAHFTTFTLTPLHSIEIGAPGAQPPFSSADLSRSVDVPQSSSSDLGSTFSSGSSGTSLTHELSSMLLAASIPSSPLPSFTPAAVTSADGSTLAQSSSKPLANAPTPPFKTDVVRRKMNSGGSHLSSIPIGNPPGNAHSTVGGSRNPPANLPSFPPQSDVGGPQV